MAVLDLTAMGTLQQQDLSSRGRRGVQIHVPYRTTPLHGLGAFTVEEEGAAFAQLADQLLPTLTKLALPGSGRGIEGLEIRSERTQQSVIWRQTAQSVRCRLRGASCIHRVGRLKRTVAGGGSARSRRLEELDFSRVIAIPIEFRERTYPSYFRARGGLRVSVFVPVRSNGQKLAKSPIRPFFYPLTYPFVVMREGTKRECESMSTMTTSSIVSSPQMARSRYWRRQLNRRFALTACAGPPSATDVPETAHCSVPPPGSFRWSIATIFTMVGLSSIIRTTWYSFYAPFQALVDALAVGLIRSSKHAVAVIGPLPEGAWDGARSVWRRTASSVVLAF